MTYLAHHGILGMKWGIRRYQNKDGTLTEAGKKRLDKYKYRWEVGEYKRTKDDAISVAKKYEEAYEERERDRGNPDKNLKAQALYSYSQSLSNHRYAMAKEIIEDAWKIKMDYVIKHGREKGSHVYRLGIEEPAMEYLLQQRLDALGHY